MTKTKQIWACSECGHTQAKWTGSCVACESWNTFIEELSVSDAGKKKYLSSSDTSAKPVPIQEVSQDPFERLITGFDEFDRLMGGGIVNGSLTLLGGAPGIGKSTFMLQLSYQLSLNKKKVLYVCGEESVKQTSLRAKRLGIKSSDIFLLNETNFDQIKHQVDLLKPDFLVIDSAQIVYKESLPSPPGSVVQVKEIAMECMHLSKGNGISTFLIGHVTKSGDLAGPRVLEHLVDTVLEFEGDRHHGYRMLRSCKNRFGPTDDVVILEMFQTGLREVKNPSNVFLEERLKESPGSVIAPTLEGSRCLLVEVQALVSKSVYSTAVRKSTGFDSNRLTLLLAVLEKRMRYALYSNDIFVSIAGGIKVQDPAMDLATVLAISSSCCFQPFPFLCVAIGEVGLNGEVRSVSHFENRLKEVIHLGFEKAIVPKKNLKNLSKELRSKIQLVGVERVDEAINMVFKTNE